MTNTSREFMKGGANIHVKAHYRIHNGKLVYVHDHDKAGKIGTEAQLHERVQFGKNKAHLMALDPEDRDTVLKHAGQLGLKPEVKYQGGKIKNEEGESKAHGFHYLKFNSEEDAKKVHESVSAASKGDTENMAAAEASSDKNISDTNAEVINAVKEHLSSINDAMAGNGDPEEAIKKIDGIVEKLNHLKKIATQGYVLETANNALEAWAERKAKLEEMVKAKGEEKPSESTNGDLEPVVGKTWKSKDGERKVVGTTLVNGNPKLLVHTEGQSHNEILDPAELDQEIEKDEKNHDFHAKANAANEEKAKQDAAKQAEYDDTDGFADSMDPIKAGKVKKVLNGNVSTAKGVMTLKKLIRDKVAGGAEVVKLHEGGSPVLRSKDGTFLDADAVTNTGLLYAQYLAKKKNDGMTGAEVAPAVDTEAANASGKLSDLMAIAEANLHNDPKKAVDALKRGAALASKHGIKYSHSNGKEFDADWMNGMAAQLEAAMPKEPEASPAYTQAAKNAVESSSAAHSITQGALESQKNGEFGPENAGNASVAHANAAGAHYQAAKAHENAAASAPTPELKNHHEGEAYKHAVNAKVHDEAKKAHDEQHKKNQANDAYNTEASKADVETQTANDHSKKVFNSETSEDHQTAANLHESAAKTHTNVIPHALKAGGVTEGHKMAQGHATKADEHKKKADYHSAAAKAYKATNKGGADHEAFDLHKEAAAKAEQAGLSDQQKKHEEHASQHAHAVYGPVREKAIKLTDEADESNTHDAHIAAAEAHADAAKVSAKFYGEDDKVSKEHNVMSKKHGEKANEAHIAENGKAPEPPKPNSPVKKETKGKYVGLKHEESAQAAESATDIHQKILHYKHAALVALHNGDESQGMAYAKKVHQLQKEHGISKSFDFDSFNAQAFASAVHEVTRKLHTERNQTRNISKAMKDLPSATKFYEACRAATYAGVDCLDDIIANAVGGKKSAAPYLHFLDNLK